jgi:hypothetical protein
LTRRTPAGVVAEAVYEVEIEHVDGVSTHNQLFHDRKRPSRLLLSIG